MMSTEQIEEFELDGEKLEIVQDFLFLGAKIEDSGSSEGELLRRFALGRAAKQDMERQIYNNYNKMQNSKCISVPSIAVWL